ncbi:MAG: hypothetical protein J5I47_07660 [Vicingus serpentipes]|nr:hypothetical protein [Vicingus serpentipes]
MSTTGIGVGNFLSDVVKIRATQREKESRDFERQREIMDHIDIYYGDYRDYDRIQKLKINYDLLNGRLDVKLYEDPLCFNVPDGRTKVGELITFDYSNISHTPLISQYANAFLGEQTVKAFNPSVKDNTPERANFLKRKATKVNKQYILENVVGPLRDQIMNEIVRKAGQIDVFNYASTPEAQMELENQINVELSKELPKDIIDLINGDVQSVTAKQAQSMLDYLSEKFNIKFQQLKGFKNAIVTGEEYYYAGEYNGGLLFEAVNPLYFTWGGGDAENEWSQRADWNKRERWLSYQQLISRHAPYLTKQDMDLIDLDIEPVGGFYKGVPFWDKDAQHTKKFMYTFSKDEGFKEMFSDVNINTIEGRKKLFHMYDLAFGRYADKYGVNFSDYGIREAHIQWRDLRPMWVVSRIMPNGRMKDFWLPEHYEPTFEDHNVREVWINQGWEGWKLGTFNPIYAKIQEIPFQYKSLFNPHDVDLSYYGKKLNTHDNTTENVALIDLGKTANKNFDMVLADIRKSMATNTGKAFTLFLNMKPEGWSYQQWLDLLRNAGLLMLDPTKLMGGLDSQFLKSIDLDRLSEIPGKLQLLSFYREQVALSMYFNDAREGQISQYANATNVQQNVSAVHNKTAFFMEQHRMVVQEALTGLLNRARHYYRDHEEEAAIFLDDTSLADLKNTPLSWYEWLGVTIDNSEEQLQKLQMLKSNMLGFIQNTSSMEAVMELIFADTKTEVYDIIKRESKRQKEEMEQSRQFEMQMNQQQTQALMQDKAQEREFEWKKHISTLQSQEQRSLIERERLALANDIDRNQINDFLQKALLEIQAKMKMHEDNLELDKEKLEVTKKLEMEKIKAMNNKKKDTSA